jgi:hypothetical protein
MHASPASKELWLKLRDVCIPEQAWYLIMRWSEDEIKKALEEHELRSVTLSDGVARSWSEFEDEEQTHEEVPQEAAEGDPGKTHYVGDDCPGGHR